MIEMTDKGKKSPSAKEITDLCKRAMELEYMIALSELKALSSVSLERSLTDKEYDRMIALKGTVFGVVG